MGIHDLFSNNADLSGMSSSATSKRLKVSSVYHQATIEVNESGSEASAVSGEILCWYYYGKHLNQFSFVTFEI